MTIVSGSLAERINIYAYICFALALTGFIYPTIVAWTWGGGWLADLGVFDFAGGLVVHATAGVYAIVIVKMLGCQCSPQKPNKCFINSILIFHFNFTFIYIYS